MFVLLIYGVFCLIGSALYDKKLTEFRRQSFNADAVVLEKDVFRYRPTDRAGLVTRYRFKVKYSDSRDNEIEGVFSTTNRCAKKIKERDIVSIAVTDHELMLKEDMPTKAWLYFLSLSAAGSIGLFILALICEFI